MAAFMRLLYQNLNSATDTRGSHLATNRIGKVSVDLAGPHDYPSRDARALASGRLSLLLALEVAPTGRATADQDGPPRADPADEYREPALGGAAHPRRAAQARV